MPCHFPKLSVCTIFLARHLPALLSFWFKLSYHLVYLSTEDELEWPPFHRLDSSTPPTLEQNQRFQLVYKFSKTFPDIAEFRWPFVSIVSIQKDRLIFVPRIIIKTLFFSYQNHLFGFFFKFFCILFLFFCRYSLDQRYFCHGGYFSLDDKGMRRLRAQCEVFSFCVAYTGSRKKSAIYYFGIISKLLP